MKLINVLLIVVLATSANAQTGPDRPRPHLDPGDEFDGITDLAVTSTPNLAAGPTDWDGDGQGDIAFLLRKWSDGKTYLVIDNKLQQRMSQENGNGKIEIAVPLNNRQSMPGEYKIAAGPLLSPHQTALLVQHRHWNQGQYQVVTAAGAEPKFNLRQVYRWGTGCRKKKAPFSGNSAMLVGQFGERRILNWLPHDRYIRAKPIPGSVVWNANPGVCPKPDDPPGYWPRQQWEPIPAPITGYYDGIAKGATVVRIHTNWWQFNTDRDNKTDKNIKFPNGAPISGDFDGDKVSDVAVWRPGPPREVLICTKPVMTAPGGGSLWKNCLEKDPENPENDQDLRIRATVPAGTPMAADYDLDGKTELAFMWVDVPAKKIKVRIDFDDDHKFTPEELYTVSYKGYHPIGEMRWAGNLRVPLPNRAD